MRSNGLSKVYRQRCPQKMIVCGQIGSEGFDEGDNRTDLARVMDALKRISKTKLSFPRKPPGHISARFILSFVHRQPSLSFLIVEVASYLKIIHHVPRAADKEIDAVGAHMVSKRKAILAHAVRKGAVVVPNAGEVITGLPSCVIRIGELDSKIGRVLGKQLRDIQSDQIGRTTRN